MFKNLFIKNFLLPDYFINRPPKDKLKVIKDLEGELFSKIKHKAPKSEIDILQTVYSQISI